MNCKEEETTSMPLSTSELESLLRGQLGPNLSVVSYTAESLTEPGENYGSLMLSLQATLDSGEKLPIVGKFVPPSPFIQQIFNSPVTFCKEIDFYRVTGPEFGLIQREKRVAKEKVLDIFPACYGARTTKETDGGERADIHAALLLENLKTKGYRVGDRLTGLDLEHGELAIARLARFHATAIGIKLKKPQVFKDKILKTCVNFRMGKKEDDDQFKRSALKGVSTIPECIPYIDKFDRALVKFLEDDHVPEEPFATIVHNDFWVNNMMFRYVDEHPADVKFVDFQVTRYGSPTRDLIFFLYTSMARDLIPKHYDDLIHLYHDNFIDCLKDLECDDGAFSFDRFQEEINKYAPIEFAHVTFMTQVICAEKEKVPSLENLSRETILNDNYSGANYARRIKCLLFDFLRNGWV